MSNGLDVTVSCYSVRSGVGLARHLWDPGFPTPTWDQMAAAGGQYCIITDCQCNVSLDGITSMFIHVRACVFVVSADFLRTNIPVGANRPRR